MTMIMIITNMTMIMTITNITIKILPSTGTVVGARTAIPRNNNIAIKNQLSVIAIKSPYFLDNR